MARKGPQIPRVCVICGKFFKVFPSDTKQCCSKKCGAALRVKNGYHNGEKWGLDAKIKRRNDPAIQLHMKELQKVGAEAALRIPAGQKGPQNRNALVWILIDPDGQYHMAVNLLDWARENKDLFFPPDVDEDAAANRISGGFKAIASSMRGVRSRERPVQTYKGWRLAGLPMPKRPEDDTHKNKEEDT